MSDVFSDDVDPNAVTPAGKTNIVDLFGPVAAQPQTPAKPRTVADVLTDAGGRELQHIIVLAIDKDGGFYMEGDDSATSAAMTWLHFSMGMALAQLLTNPA